MIEKGYVMTGQLHDVEAQTLERWIEEGSVCVIDVREKCEFDVSRIAGATLVPLSTFSSESLPKLPENTRYVFHCKAGVRSAKAAKQYMQETGTQEAYHLKGGLDAWAMSRCPLEIRMDGHYRLQCLVNMVLGSTLTISSLLSLSLNPNFSFLSLLVAALMLHAGVTGTSLPEWFLSRFL